MSKFKIVPVEPTEEMLSEGDAATSIASGYIGEVAEIYSSMIDAAPCPWVPVSERLPESKDADSRNTIFAWNGDSIIFVGLDRFQEKIKAFGITHWMPMIEGPKV